MSSAVEVIRQQEKAMIPTRLVRGAEILGRLWREGVRCLGEWSGACPCVTKTDFCQVKESWLGLVKELVGGPPYDLPWNGGYVLSGTEGWLVLEAMTVRMVKATGLTLKIATPGERALLRVGPKGTDFGTLIDLAAISPGPDQDAAVDAIVKIQNVFK